MGKQKTPTSTGLFHTNWRAKRTRSTINWEWVMYHFNLDNFKGISMRNLKCRATQPHTHVSECLNTTHIGFILGQKNGKLPIITITAYGTPVIVFGNYPFGQRKILRLIWMKIAIHLIFLRKN